MRLFLGAVPTLLFAMVGIARIGQTFRDYTAYCKARNRLKCPLEAFDLVAATSQLIAPMPTTIALGRAPAKSFLSENF